MIFDHKLWLKVQEVCFLFLQSLEAVGASICKKPGQINKCVILVGLEK